jgi:GxxExxY protein
MMERTDFNYYAKQIIDCAFQVHKELGPGLLESIYQCCLYDELIQRSINVKQEVFLPVHYKGRSIKKDFRIDLLVADEIIIEVKAIEVIAPIHEAQLLSYLKLSKKWLGFLINFNVPVLKVGIKRMVNGYL